MDISKLKIGNIIYTIKDTIARNSIINLTERLNNLSTVARTGHYNDLLGKPTIPTKTSQLDNDSGFSTFSGNYNDLSNKPTIPIVDSGLNDFSTNAIQNRAVYEAIENTKKYTQIANVSIKENAYAELLSASCYEDNTNVYIRIQLTLKQPIPVGSTYIEFEGLPNSLIQGVGLISATHYNLNATIESSNCRILNNSGNVFAGAGWTPIILGFYLKR